MNLVRFGDFVFGARLEVDEVGVGLPDVGRLVSLQSQRARLDVQLRGVVAETTITPALLQ